MILLFRKSKVIFFSLLSNAWLIFLESAHARPPPSRSRENGNGPNKGRVRSTQRGPCSFRPLPPAIVSGDRHETNSKCTLLSFPPFSASRPSREEWKRKRTTKPKRQLKASPVPPLVVEGGGGKKFSPFERGRQEQAVRKNIQAGIFRAKMQVCNMF